MLRWIRNQICCCFAQDFTVSPSDAEKEYSEAIRLQEELHKQELTNALYQQELARTYYNRGIIRYGMHADDGMRSDFQKAIELLEPLISETHAAVDTSENPDPAQDLARVYNDYAIVVSNSGQTTEAQDFYEKAIALAEQLVQKRPENREYKVELAQYCINEARMLGAVGESRLTEARSERALKLVEDLAEPTPSLSIKLVQALQLRGQLLVPHDPDEAKTLTDQAFDLLRNVEEKSVNNTAPFSAVYMNIGTNYFELAQDDLERGNRAGAEIALAHLKAILPHLSLEDRQILIEPYQNLQGKLSIGPSRH